MITRSHNQNDRIIKLHQIYTEKKSEIEKRLNSFYRIRRKRDNTLLYEELIFCILTPQSRPRMAEKTIEILREKKLLYSGSESELAQHLHLCRFRYGKAKSIAASRHLLEADSLLAFMEEHRTRQERRRLLAANVRGIGLKEASHFMRNTGYETDAAILDRHVLRFLEEEGLIDSVPKSLSPAKYDLLEEKLIALAARLAIPPSALDFVVFYQRTGEIFK